MHAYGASPARTSLRVCLRCGRQASKSTCICAHDDQRTHTEPDMHVRVWVSACMRVIPLRRKPRRRGSGPALRSNVRIPEPQYLLNEKGPVPEVMLQVSLNNASIRVVARAHFLF